MGEGGLGVWESWSMGRRIRSMERRIRNMGEGGLRVWGEGGLGVWGKEDWEYGGTGVGGGGLGV